jgi:hypothetical protein
MRTLGLLATATTIALSACERFEAPQYAQREVLRVDVVSALGPGGAAVRLVKDRRPRYLGPQEALFQGGQLRLENGCLLMDQALIVWPREARLDLTQADRVLVADEGVLATVGHYLSVTGGAWPGRLENPDLGPCADFPVFVVNDFRPMTPEAWAAFHAPEPPPPRPDRPNPRPMPEGPSR